MYVHKCHEVGHADYGMDLSNTRLDCDLMDAGMSGDRGLIRKAESGIAYDARSPSIHWFINPVVNHTTVGEGGRQASFGKRA